MNALRLLSTIFLKVLKRFPDILKIILYATVFFLPLVSSRFFYFGSTFTKTIFFTTMVEITFVLWISQHSWKPQKFFSPFFVVVGIFFLSFIISYLTGVDMVQSLWSNYERMMGIWTLGHVFVFFIILSTSFNREQDWAWMFRVMALSALVVSLVGVIQFFETGTSTRITSTVSNSAFLATYLLLSSSAPFILFIHGKKINAVSVGWFSVLTLILFVLVLTGTRGAMLGTGILFMVAALMFLFFGPSREATLGLSNTTAKKIVTGLFAISVLGVLLGVVFRGSLVNSSFNPLRRLASVSFSSPAVEGRVLAWRVGWEGWREHFLFGWGVGNYNILFDRYYDPRLVDQEPWFDRAHNFVVDFGASTGILGLFAYFALFVLAIRTARDAWRRGRVSFWVFVIVSATFTAHLFQSLFVFDTLSSLVVLFVLFAYIQGLSMEERGEFTQKKWTPQFFVYPALALMFLLFYLGTWKPAQESRIGLQGYQAFAAGQDARAKVLIEQALLYDTYGNIDVRRSVAEYVFDFLKAGGYSRTSSRVRNEDEMKGVIDYAIAKMEENIQERPMDVKWRMYQGQLYNLGAIIFSEPNQEFASAAEQRFLESRELSPGRPQIYLEIAQARKIQGNISGMWEILDDGTRLAPTYRAMHYNALAHAIDLKDLVREKKEIEYIYRSEAFPDYRTITEAYFRAGRFGDAVRVQKDHIAQKEPGLGKEYKNEEIAALYKDLAALERGAGNKAGARDAALRYGELMPEKRAEVEAFLRSLGF